MPEKYISVDLDPDEKEVILKHASFLISSSITQKDLANKRVKWVRFLPHTITAVIGELSYHFNRTKSDYQFHLLDRLICNLEHYEK